MKKILNYQFVLIISALVTHSVSSAQPVNPQPGENIWHLIAAVGTEVDTINTNQTACCVGTATVLAEIGSAVDTIQTSSCNLSSVFSSIAIISAQESIIDTKVDALSQLIVADFATTFSLIAAIPPCDLTSAYTLLNQAINQEFTTQSKLDMCCATLTSKVDSLISTASTVYACAATEISQSSVINGAITLSLEGGVYCLSEDVTSDITLTSSNITLDLNNHILNGTISIVDGADQGVVTNGRIIPLVAPTDNTTAQEGAVLVQASQAQLTNLIIQCPTSISDGINGLTGIRVEDSDTLIKNCLIISGTGATTSVASNTGGNGGVGIDLAVSADNTHIIQSEILTGNGGSSTLAGFGGTSGNGINVTGSNVLILETTITTGIGGNGGPSNATNPAGNGGASGIGINTVELSDNNLNVIRSIITTGSGGTSGTNTLAGSSPAVGGTSGIGINNTISFSTFSNCLISTGTGGFGNTGSSVNAAGGNGGNSGIGINNSATQSVNILNCEIVTNFGGNGVLGTSTALQGSAGSSGVGIYNTASIVAIENNIIRTLGGGFAASSSTSLIAGGAGGSTGTGIYNTGSSTSIISNNIFISAATNGGNGDGANAVGGNSGTGIYNTANTTYIQNNEIFVRVAGNGGSALSTAIGSLGGNGGDAITTSGNNVGILSNTLTSGAGGNGGNGVAGNTNGGNGGNGGNGITFSAGDVGQSRKNTIVNLGIGGNGGTGLTTGNGGKGGDGVFIGASATHTEVGLNTIQSTGTAGTGGTPLAAGYAVNDTATAASPNASVIYSNTAFLSANTTPSAYNIASGSASTSGNSVALTSSTNFLDNVHIP